MSPSLPRTYALRLVGFLVLIPWLGVLGAAISADRVAGARDHCPQHPLSPANRSRSFDSAGLLRFSTSKPGAYAVRAVDSADLDILIRPEAARHGSAIRYRGGINQPAQSTSPPTTSRRAGRHTIDHDAGRHADKPGERGRYPAHCGRKRPPLRRRPGRRGRRERPAPPPSGCKAEEAGVDDDQIELRTIVRGCDRGVPAAPPGHRGGHHGQRRPTRLKFQALVSSAQCDVGIADLPIEAGRACARSRSARRS